ncbi:hypothetical protein B0J14DRAFT_602149 [Halenospora varia]|nr:hypothetical protein B0J14DRAFT_602149 [Halenospora varia]
MGNQLRNRFERTGKMENLEDAIQMARQVLEVTPKSYPDLAGRLINLGIVLEIRFGRTENLENLEEAIQLARQAVDLTPEDHPDLVGNLEMAKPVFVQDTRVEQSKEAEFYRIGSRAWEFSARHHVVWRFLTGP